jgi:hypothetical protein
MLFICLSKTLVTGQRKNSRWSFSGDKLLMIPAVDFSVYNLIRASGLALAADSIPHAWRKLRHDLPEVSTKKISRRRGTFDDEVSALLMPSGNFNFGCVT